MLRTLDGIKRGHRNKIVRPTLAKAARVVVKDARKRVPKDTGALRRSLTSIIRTSKSGNLYAVVGPETGIKKDRKTGAKTKTAFGKWLEKQGIENRPANYAHLVERGHVAAGWNKGRAVPPHPFLKPALTASMAEIRQIIRDGLREGLVAYYAKASTRAA